MDKKYNFTSLYVVLTIFAVTLIISGLLLPIVLAALNISASKTVLIIFQSAFILSGLTDFGLLIYAVKKLKQ